MTHTHRKHAKLITRSFTTFKIRLDMLSVSVTVPNLDKYLNVFTHKIAYCKPHYFVKTKTTLSNTYKLKSV
jgi:hypothetical protein